MGSFTFLYAIIGDFVSDDKLLHILFRFLTQPNDCFCSFFQLTFPEKKTTVYYMFEKIDVKLVFSY